MSAKRRKISISSRNILYWESLGVVRPMLELLLWSVDDPWFHPAAPTPSVSMWCFAQINKKCLQAVRSIDRAKLLAYWELCWENGTRLSHHETMKEHARNAIRKHGVMGFSKWIKDRNYYYFVEKTQAEYDSTLEGSPFSASEVQEIADDHNRASGQLLLTHMWDRQREAQMENASELTERP